MVNEVDTQVLNLASCLQVTIKNIYSNTRNASTFSLSMFGRRCFQLRRFNPYYGAYAVRLETAPTGVIARIFPSPVGEVCSPRRFALFN